MMADVAQIRAKAQAISTNVATYRVHPPVARGRRGLPSPAFPGDPLGHSVARQQLAQAQAQMIAQKVALRADTERAHIVTIKAQEVARRPRKPALPR